MKDPLPGKISGSKVNNAVQWGLQVLNDKETMSLTSDLYLAFTAKIFTQLWTKTIKDAVEA